MMYRKGFTLIELIVVIAIIGVLAMILVPTLLGYVKKSKISSANTSASVMYKAVSSALLEMNAEGKDVGGTYTLTWNQTSKNWTASRADVEIDCDIFRKKVAALFEKIEKVNKCEIAVTNEVCVAVAMARDSTYVGTYPAGVITSENYTDFVPTGTTSVNNALACAMIINYGGDFSTITAAQSAINTIDSEGFVFTYSGKKSTVS